MFFTRHVYKNYSNVLIELWPNPGLVQALSVKPHPSVLSDESYNEYRPTFK